MGNHQACANVCTKCWEIQQNPQKLYFLIWISSAAYSVYLAWCDIAMETWRKEARWFSSIARKYFSRMSVFYFHLFWYTSIYVILQRESHWVIIQSTKTKFLFLKKLRCCVGASEKNLVLSNEFGKVELQPLKIWKADIPSENRNCGLLLFFSPNSLGGRANSRNVSFRNLSRL